MFTIGNHAMITIEVQSALYFLEICENFTNSTSYRPALQCSRSNPPILMQYRGTTKGLSHSEEDELSRLMHDPKKALFLNASYFLPRISDARFVRRYTS